MAKFIVINGIFNRVIIIMYSQNRGINDTQ